MEYTTVIIRIGRPTNPSFEMKEKSTGKELDALVSGINRLKGALEHAIAVMEIAVGEPNDPDKLFDPDLYRKIIQSVEDSLA